MEIKNIILALLAVVLTSTTVEVAANECGCKARTNVMMQDDAIENDEMNQEQVNEDIDTHSERHPSTTAMVKRGETQPASRMSGVTHSNMAIQPRGSHNLSPAEQKAALLAAAEKRHKAQEAERQKQALLAAAEKRLKEQREKAAQEARIKALKEAGLWR